MASNTVGWLPAARASSVSWRRRRRGPRSGRCRRPAAGSSAGTPAAGSARPPTCPRSRSPPAEGRCPRPSPSPRTRLEERRMHTRVTPRQVRSGQGIHIHAPYSHCTPWATQPTSTSRMPTRGSLAPLSTLSPPKNEVLATNYSHTSHTYTPPEVETEGATNTAELVPTIMAIVITATPSHMCFFRRWPSTPRFIKAVMMMIEPLIICHKEAVMYSWATYDTAQHSGRNRLSQIWIREESTNSKRVHNKSQMEGTIKIVIVL